MKAALTFGNWLKWRRRGLGLTQKELAQQVGYAAVTLRKVEADELRPSWQMARKLAEVLQLEPEEQAQFVRFARDEAHWDDIALPTRAAPPLIPPADLPEEPAPYRNGEQEQPALAAIARQRLNVTTDTVHEDERPPLGLGAQTRNGEFDLSRPKHNLPAQTTPLIGREQELAELSHWLADPATRLVTILSAGGMGKTHLAVAAALQQVERFANGVCWVALAPLTDAKELVLAIAAALGLQFQGGGTPEQQVCDFLRAKHLLLVLDNFEHLMEGAPLVSVLLAAAPQLSILVTSRQRLKLSSETVMLLDGLRFPTDRYADPLDYPAVQLFLLHARRVRPHYRPDERDVAGIVEVCRLVHGMPLGVLLAAAWSGVMSPPEIAAEMEEDLGFLHTDMQDMPARHRHLRAVFLHTWSRLSAAECNVMMRLSVFRGGTTVEAVQRVTGATADVLVGLIDKALLWRLPSGRYMIHELLRQFAAEQLAGDDVADEGRQREAQLRHSRYYLSLLGEQEQQLQDHRQRAALDAIRADFENMSVAWRWAVQEREFALLAPAIHPLFLYCEVRGNFREGVILFAIAAAELTSEAEASTPNQATLLPLLGRVWVRLGACEVEAGNCQRGEQLIQDSLPLITQDRERALALAYLGDAAFTQGDLSLARTLFSSSLAISQQCNDAAGIANALRRSSSGLSDYAEACRRCTESLALWRTVGRLDQIASTLTYLGWFSWCHGDYAKANACWREGIALCEQLELHNEKAWALDCIGFAAWCQRDMASAERHIREALAIYTALGRQGSISMCKAELALVLVSMGRVEQAVSLARQAVTATRELNHQMMLIVSLNYLGAALIAAGELGKARQALIEAVQRAWGHKYLFTLMTAFYYFAELLELESHNAESHGALERKSLAVTLLSCVCSQTAGWAAYRDKAAQLQAEIEGALPTEMLAGAIRNGKSRTLEELVSTLLGG